MGIGTSILENVPNEIKRIRTVRYIYSGFLEVEELVSEYA